MIGTIAVAGTILANSVELLKNPAISDAVTGLYGWLKKVLTSNSARKKLELIEENKHNEETIIGLKSSLEDLLEDNAELQEQFTQKIQEIEKLMKQEKISFNTKTINVTVSGNDNITATDINKSNITINKH